MVGTNLLLLTNFQVVRETRASVLSNELLGGLKNRLLCDEVTDSPTGQKVFCLRKLVKQSASIFRRRDSPEGQRLVVRYVKELDNLKL